MNFEDRSIYDPATDPVAGLVLTVECNPGQVDSLMGYLRGIQGQAGVYAAILNVIGVKTPVESAVEEENTHGKQAIQQPSLDAQATGIGIGSEAGGGGEPGLVDAGKDGELAGASGEVGTGPLERSA